MGAAQSARELVEKVTGHPAAESSCPWLGYYAREVLAVIEAHIWWPNVSEWWGEDPEWWLVEGVGIYHRALERTRYDVLETKRKK